MSTKKKIIEIVGNELGPIIFNKIKKECGELSLNETIKIVYNICNYIDSNKELTYDNLKNINKIWSDFLSNYKQNYDASNYIETNKIILDYRINDIGFYWIDLKKPFCIESMIRMKDCGRVKYNRTTLELREQSLESNKSHMIVVYNTITNDINQIKGRKSSKPNKKYWGWFYKFLMDTDYTINEYIPTYKHQSDLKISDLPITSQLDIYLKYPKLKNTII